VRAGHSDTALFLIRRAAKPGGCDTMFSITISISELVGLIDVLPLILNCNRVKGS
jgi:hypothetical protein